MDIRKTVVFDEEIAVEHGTRLASPLRRVALGVVLKNPLVGKPVGTDLAPLIDISFKVGDMLTRKALELIGDPKNLRAYSKAALVGTAGDLEHGAVMIHARIGMAMRGVIRRGRVPIPGNAKVVAPGAHADMIFGPIDDGWDLDAIDTMPVMVADAPRPDEILLLVGYMAGPRPHARSKGPDQKDVDALLKSFA
ncbi:amino acid synthesis family protein [Bradyrhizobium prioriisuperbiae]|uniref:amino acid synthesis family protein n=1 Tax=Bradyrhizobium prioriisuperbiae TaxID=2854389 RepID=UPI0028EC682F|nr:amino acid synthesis family protein [Bradyrhizobium prioritasuperba]